MDKKQWKTGRYTFAFIPAGNLGVSGSLSGDFAEYPGRQHQRTVAPAGHGSCLSNA